MKKTLVILFSSITLFLSSCSTNPEPIKFGSDNCNYCKMTITDNRFGAELVTNKGKIYKFDEISCMIGFATEEGIESKKIKGMYISDFCGSNQLLDKNKSYFLQSDSLKSPMGGNVATFSNNDSLKIYSQKMSGKTITWDEVVKNSLEE